MAGEGGGVSKVLPVILDRVPEIAAEVRSMITALHMQLANLGRWVDRQGRVDGSLFCGSLVPEFTGPQTLGDLLVPATPKCCPDTIVACSVWRQGWQAQRPGWQTTQARRCRSRGQRNQVAGEDVAKAEGAQEVTDTTRICFFFFGQCRIA